MTMRTAHKLDTSMPLTNNDSPTSETRLRAPLQVTAAATNGASDDLLGSEVTFSAAMGDALADILRFERRQA